MRKTSGGPQTNFDLYRKRVDDIKSRDLRSIAPQLIGYAPSASYHNHDKYISPVHSEDTASFAVYADGFKNYGAGGESGDHIALVRLLHPQMTFREALDYLDGGHFANAPIAAPQNKIKQDEPPSAEWQAAMREFIDAAHERLLNSAEALMYLQAERGLSIETIRRFKLGFNPDWMKTGFRDERGVVKAALGIVIPWIAAGQVWAVRIRTPQGSLADWLDCKPHTDLPKYTSIRGSRQSAGLFNADSIADGQPLLMVEGEFDAILAQQDLGIPTVTRGSSGDHKHIKTRWLEQIKRAENILSLLDNDSAGRRATEHLKTQLGQITRLTLPSGKDISEYLIEQQGDAQMLIEQCQSATESATQADIAEKAEDRLQEHKPLWWWLSTPPVAWISLLLSFGYNSASTVIRLHRAFLAGKLDPAHFTVGEAMEATGLNRARIDKALKYLDDVFFSSDLSTYGGVEIQHSKSTKKGRKQKTYCIITGKQLRDKALEAITVRLREHCFVGVPAMPDASFASNNDLTDDDLELWEQHVMLLRSRLSEEERKPFDSANRLFRRELSGDSRGWQGWRQALSYKHLHLNIGDEWDNDRDIRHALLQAYLEYHDGETHHTRAEYRRLLGYVSDGTLQNDYKAVGVETIPQFEQTQPQPVDVDKLDEQIDKAQRTHRGRLVELRITRAGEAQPSLILSGFRDDLAQLLAAETQQGDTVVMTLQVASLQRLVGPSAQTSKKTPQSGNTARKKRARVAYKVTEHDPVWVESQLALLLCRVMPYVLDHQGRLCWFDGEVILEQPTISTLLELLAEVDLDDGVHTG